MHNICTPQVGRVGGGMVVVLCQPAGYKNRFGVAGRGGVSLAPAVLLSTSVVVFSEQ